MFKREILTRPVIMLHTCFKLLLRRYLYEIPNTINSLLSLRCRHHWRNANKMSVQAYPSS